MPVLATDLKFYLSGGAANSDPDASLGGVISTTEIGAGLHNLFDIVGSAEASAGDTEYRCLYVKNTAAQPLLNAVVFISSNTPSADTSAEIGLGTSAINGTEQTVADESTAPAGVTFSTADGEGNALAIGDMAAGATKAVWVKRIVSASASAASADAATLDFKGDTEA